MVAFQPHLIVVPVDFSESSQNSIAVALDLAGDVGKLRLLHVLPPLEAISPAVVWGDLSDKEREKAVRKHAIPFLQKLGVLEAAFDVRVGNPANEIVEYAEEVNADLVVIASHGYHGLKRFLLGSVAESVIRHARCAVLVLRRQDAE